MRRFSRTIHVGNVAIGGNSPISVQSMTNTDTRNIDATLSQINRMADQGCDIVRCAVPDQQAAEALGDISRKSPIPVIADIHFDYRLALSAISAGVNGVRINPGNIGSQDGVKQVAEAAGMANIPIRVGANSGSLSREMREKMATWTHLTQAERMSEALVQSALTECESLEKYGFRDIKVSLKASNVVEMVAATRLFAARTDYPLHIGVTEAGTPARGIIKSAVGIGALLLDGIGDTLRVSLTADPVSEIAPALRILESCGLRDSEPEIVSCPTCGRTEIDLISLAQKVEELIASYKAAHYRINLKKIAVMGCVVNGPGEAKDAELGIAGGRGKIAIFSYGNPIGTYSETEGFTVFQQKLEELLRKE